MGYEEMPHQADCAMRVWASSMGELYAEAARAFSALSGAHGAPGTRITREISLQGPDAESLLTAFLTELIFFQEHDALAFDEFYLDQEGLRLSGLIVGSPVLSVARPIKAVTFHQLAIRHTHAGVEVEVVFDV